MPLIKKVYKNDQNFTLKIHPKNEFFKSSLKTKLENELSSSDEFICFEKRLDINQLKTFRQNTIFQSVINLNEKYANIPLIDIPPIAKQEDDNGDNDGNGDSDNNDDLDEEDNKRINVKIIDEREEFKNRKDDTPKIWKRETTFNGQPIYRVNFIFYNICI